ncbi:hypothetical protein L6R52_34205 [Myxococcota bacterium]|nr:hypothetical protein [Myxococcota bacterium]
MTKRDHRAEAEAEERKQLRPYRRLVGAIFAIAVVVACVLVFRGIIRHLDRLPSLEGLDKPKVVDVRALRACAEDLDRLELRIRTLAGQAFAELPVEGAAQSPWDVHAKQLELERLSIVARCRLNEPTTDGAVADLEKAVGELEELLRSYSLLYARHKESGIPSSKEAREALRRALAALAAR